LGVKYAKTAIAYDTKYGQICMVYPR